MKKIIPIILLALICIISGYYLGRYYPVDSVSDNQKRASIELRELLQELNGVISSSNAKTEDVNDFLVSKYGPCWGIPDGQCRE